MKIIIYTNIDGTVSVITPAPQFIKNFDGNEEAALSAVFSRSTPDDAIGAIWADTADLPNRVFRDAWKQVEGKTEVDIPKARIIHMDRIREVRNDELKKEDINFQKALEADDASVKAAVATKKQTLRDLPATFDLSGASTDDELNALWPSELPERS